MSTTTDRILTEIMISANGVTQDTAQFEMFQAVAELARASAQITAPTDHGSNPASWLSDADYLRYERYIISGAKARVFALPGKPWSNLPLAETYTQFWMDGLRQVREQAATTTGITGYADRVMNAVRVSVPGALDPAIKQEMFSVVTELCLQALQITPPVSGSTDPTQWLTDVDYGRYQNYIVEGTIARLLLQPGKPWSSPEFGAVHAALWADGLRQAREQAATSVAPASASERVMMALRAAVPGLRDPAIKHELFNAVVELCQYSLQITPPAPGGTDPATWLNDATYTKYQRYLIDGALSRLLAEPGKPWFNPELAGVHATYWQDGLRRAREENAAVASPTNAYERVMATLRTAIPGALDSNIQQELFNVVDEVARDILQIAPPPHNAAPASWLTDGQWAQHFRLIVAGVTFRMLLQSHKPWTDAALASVHRQLWMELSTQSRIDVDTSAGPTASDRLMDMLRTQLPGAPENTILAELFSVLQRMCRWGWLWIETRNVVLTNGVTVYTPAPAGTEIIQLLKVDHPTLGLRGTTFLHGTLTLPYAPTAGDVAEGPVEATWVLAPAVNVSNAAVATWVPADIWSERFELIKHGVLGNMMAQPAKPYSNPVLAQFHLRSFEAQLATARVEVRNTGAFNVQAWRFPRLTARYH